MNSHCLIILSMMFPLHSISAQATPCNEGCSLIQTRRRIIAWHVDSNMKHMVPQMHVTSIESSNSEATIDLRSWRGHKNWHHRRRLRNAYMVLIVIGWGTFLPIGVIIARYFKKIPMLSKEWYSFHIIFQSIGYILGTIGWVTGICLGNTSQQFANRTQRILSILVFTFLTVQMLAIFWQPKKEDEFRKWWQIYHRFLGCAVISLIIANIFVGINNQSQAEKLKLVYAVILGGLALIALALEIFRCFTYKILHRSMELNSNMYTCP
ncbi:cytochrome b561 and DOMON domain-containing protein At5g35735-like [Quercus lobata]|uniref:cytochrome b561 and DOMON domain-containing protein At5g35735-like n=1 Tax=Quercus lobata TaxID=97700 RepID=UPI001246FCAD|nr:cytochrome b561 and DOMON domain-containing protein At5g35735-like [Quercus lobata]